VSEKYIYSPLLVIDAELLQLIKVYYILKGSICLKY
jgi:hypothetical protein